MTRSSQRRDPDRFRGAAKLRHLASPLFFGLLAIVLFIAGALLFLSGKGGYAGVIAAVAIVTLAGISMGLAMANTIASPLSILIGGDDYTPSAFAKPPYNPAIAENFLVTRRFDKALKQAGKMIRYYPKEEESYVQAYEAIQLGELGEKELDWLDRLSRKNLGRKIDRSIKVDPASIEWRGPKVIMEPPTYEKVVVPRPGE